MLPTRPLLYHHHRSPLVNQVLAAIIRDHPFDATLAVATLAVAASPDTPWTTQTVSQVLRSIPTFFFLSTRSIGRQQYNPTRHRSPLKQRNLQLESDKLQKGSLVLGPAAYRDPTRIDFGVFKTTQFFYWVESQFGFTHNEITVREMAIVLVKANKLKELWDFLKNMSRRENGLVTTMSTTCLIKCLGQEGLVNEAMHCFYRMKQFHCKPDVYAYNTMINALCRVGFFKKAKFLLQQMELPGFRCPPDVYTYTILISAFCKHSMQTGCKKAIRRRLWEANHLFRLMLFKGFVPDIVTYNSLIDGCCKTYRIERALELLEDMKKRGCVPNRVTYDSLIRYYSVVNEIDKAVQVLRSMREMGHGIPSTSSYTPIIHALCEAGRVVEAWEFLVELVNGGLIPREYTFKLVRDALCSRGKADVLDEGLCRKIEDGIAVRYKEKMNFKPIMSRKNSGLLIEDV